MRIMDRHTYELLHDEAAYQVFREFAVVASVAAVILALYQLMYRFAV